MACRNLMPAYQGKTPNPRTGKLPIVFQAREAAQSDETMWLPCGVCIGCRLERARQWAVRCVHEASLYERNCFITLTYDAEHLPPGGTLVKEHFQEFMKRLRRRYGAGVRYFHCGEYGAKRGRPHYHALLFNFDFPDKYHWETTERGDKLYRSPALDGLIPYSTDRSQKNPTEELVRRRQKTGLYGLWPYGNSNIGAVTFESASYVARYIMKKAVGDEAQEEAYGMRYENVSEVVYDSNLDALDGLGPAVVTTRKKVYDKLPEYTTMSRNPGIGAPWFDKYPGDVYPADRVILRGMEVRPPKYYDSRFELDNPEVMEEVKMKRTWLARHSGPGISAAEAAIPELRKSLLAMHPRSPERRSVLERMDEIKLDKLKRGYEHD